MSRTRLITRGAIGLLFVFAGCDSGGGGDETSDTEASTSVGTEATSTGVPTTGQASTGQTSTTGTGSSSEGTSSDGSSTSSGADTGTTGTGADTGSSEDAGSTGEALPIPDPGQEMDAWQSQGEIGTPGTAWPVGVATQEVPYVEGVSAEDGNAFFVFEAGPALTSLDIQVFGGADPEVIHLHDGTGLTFGPEIPPDSMGASQATFSTVPGQVYVLELTFPGAGFF